MPTPSPASPLPPPRDRAGAVRNAHRFFETESGWSPPTVPTLAEWLADGVCRCPDDCVADADGWCEHGIASWWLVLVSVRSAAPAPWDPALMVPHPERFDLGAAGALAAVEAHETAVERGQGGYFDPETGLFVMTAWTLWQRGYCCANNCRHCPWVVLD